MFKRMIAFAAALVCGVLFAGCARPSADVGAAEVELLENGKERVVLRVTAGDETKSLYDALAVLDEAGELSLEGSRSETGFFIESVNGTAMTDGAFWAVYTSLGGEYADASWGTFEYEGRVLASATLGVSGLPLEKGAYFALVYTVY